MMKAIIYKASNGLWYAKIVARNGEKVWKTGDGYERKAGAMKAVTLLKSPVIEIIVK